MNNEEAKFILSAYRPGGGDANDPHFADALEQVRRDPALSEWFRQEQEFDSIVAEQLSSVRPPADLRATILVGGEASRPAGRKRPFLWGIAALVAICAGVLGVWVESHEPATPKFADWQESALNFLENAPQLDALSSNSAELLEWLRTANSPTPAELPAALAKLEALGCKTLEVNGSRVSVLCFYREDGKLIHLVTLDLPSGAASPAAEPLFRQLGDLTTVSWTKGDEAFMLVTEGKPLDLAKYL